MQKITPMLWFDNNAEEAVEFYKSVFKKSDIGETMINQGNAPGEKGKAMVVPFEFAESLGWEDSLPGSIRVNPAGPVSKYSIL